MTPVRHPRVLTAYARRIDPERPAWSELCDAHRWLVEEYCTDLNVRRAALVTGYDLGTATSFCRYELRAAVDETLKLRFDRIGLAGDEILRDIAIVRDKCMGRLPVKIDVAWDALLEEWVPHEIYTWDAPGANKALENLGRYRKLFTDTVVVKSHEQEMEEVWANARRYGFTGEIVGGLPVLQSDLPEDSAPERDAEPPDA